MARLSRSADDSESTGAGEMTRTVVSVRSVFTRLRPIGG